MDERAGRSGGRRWGNESEEGKRSGSEVGGAIVESDIGSKG